MAQLEITVLQRTQAAEGLMVYCVFMQERQTVELEQVRQGETQEKHEPAFK
jgi:hypothetical protein